MNTLSPKHTLICVYCRQAFTSQRSDAQTCSNRCRTAKRKGTALPDVILPAPAPLHVFPGLVSFWEGDTLVSEFETHGCRFQVRTPKGNYK